MPFFEEESHSIQHEHHQPHLMNGTPTLTDGDARNTRRVCKVDTPDHPDSSKQLTNYRNIDIKVGNHDSFKSRKSSFTNF
jgi:hypothetical protein